MKLLSSALVVLLLFSVPAFAVKICPPPEKLEPANDKTYGVSKKNPIVVGHVGPKNIQAFMALLRGPNGEKVTYERAGSCCTFKTPQALVGGTAMLEKFKVGYEGSKKSVIFYFNQYDCGTAMLPEGFTTE